MNENNLPAIMLYGFENIEACFSLALELRSRGYPVVAACEPGDAEAAEAACAFGCTLLEAGRGEELRAGLSYFRDNLADQPGIVTVNASEGYLADDIIQVADAMKTNPGKLVIASRADDPAIGLFARLERLCARLAFALVHGRRVRDPWAGLKAIPAALVSAFPDLRGEGRRFEFAVVLNLQHKGIKAVSVSVAAKYGFSEGSGFWDRAGDIFRILILPFKFITASLAATGGDYAMYIAFSRLILPGHAYVALTVGRATGAVTGYLLNRSVVFRLKNNTWRKELAAAAKFALLALFNYGASWLLLYALHTLLGINDIVARMMSDALLFVVSYTIQREFVFRRRSPTGK